MNDELSVIEQVPLSPEIASAMATARNLAEASRSKNTRDDYRSGWNQFLRFCREHHPTHSTLPAPPAMVALYLGWLRDQGRVAQTLRARAAAIAFYHRQAELHSPCDHKFVKDVLEGASRKDAGREHGRATVTLDDLENFYSVFLPRNRSLKSAIAQSPFSRSPHLVGAQRLRRSTFPISTSVAADFFSFGLRSRRPINVAWE